MATATIGTSQTYTDVSGFETATDNALSEIERGELTDDKVYATHIQFLGATGHTSSIYRELTAKSGNEWDEAAQTGPILQNDTSAAQRFYALRADEPFTRFSFMRIEQSYTVDGQPALRMASTDGLVIGVVGAANGNAPCVGLYDTGTDTTLESCIANGEGNASGMDNGIVLAGTTATVTNCLAWDVSNTTNGWGIRYGTQGHTVKNCVAADCVDNWNNYSSGTATNNASTSTDAPGTSAQNSITATDEWEDPANGDFTQKTTGSLYEAGAVLGAASFLIGVDHGDATGTDNIGPYDGPVAPAATVPIVYHHRQRNFGC